jgi:hypothetical protein
VAKKLLVNRGAPSDQLAPIVRLDATQLNRVGFKLKYRVDERSGAVIPRIWVEFPQQITIQSPILKRVRPESESFVRFVIDGILASYFISPGNSKWPRAPCPLGPFCVLLASATLSAQ